MVEISLLKIKLNRIFKGIKRKYFNRKNTLKKVVESKGLKRKSVNRKNTLKIFVEILY
jgi:hypothetical protein